MLKMFQNSKSNPVTNSELLKEIITNIVISYHLKVKGSLFLPCSPWQAIAEYIGRNVSLDKIDELGLEESIYHALREDCPDLVDVLLNLKTSVNSIRSVIQTYFVSVAEDSHLKQAILESVRNPLADDNEVFLKTVHALRGTPELDSLKASIEALAEASREHRAEMRI